jgi:hypothetical protein
MKESRAASAAHATAITRALPDIRLPAPRARPWLLAAARFLAWPYLRLAQGNSKVAIRNGERLVEAFRAALSQETRLIVAFRHPYGDEAQVLGWLFLRGVELEAKRLGVSLPRRPHALFVHGYEVPRWSGALVRWMLPRMGAMPVHHAKMDREGMDRIRRAIEAGGYPVALAPEGQVSYASDRVPRLEQGTMRLGLAAADDLAKKGREEPVLVLPLSVHRRYPPRSAADLERLLAALERALGYSRDLGKYPVRERLGRARDELIGRAERFYGLSPEPMSLLEERLAGVVLEAVESGERLLDLRHKPEALIDRVYGIRQKGWDLIYLAGDPRALPPLDRALADRRAAEAWYAMRHMELADFAWYFRTELPPEASFGDGASSAALIEYAENLWDFANRLMGGAISGRKNLRPHESVIIAAEPINLSARLADYHGDRRLCAERATADLAAAYNTCIEEFIHG